MSDAGGYSDDDYGERSRGNSEIEDRLSDVDSGSPSEEEEEEDQMNLEDDEDNDNQEEEHQYPMSSIIEEPTFSVSNTDRITPPFLTKYEKARVIGVRAMQISKNSPLYLNADDSKQPSTQRT